MTQNVTVKQTPNRQQNAPSSRIDQVRELFLLGFLILAATFGGLIGWSIFAPFQGAVLTSGHITVEGNQQAVQHLSGGIVKDIFVSDGKRVKKGDELLHLDTTSASANLASINARLMELLATEARLVAERDSTSNLKNQIWF